ncbi:unnamed protein product, partial [Timema podura]|nr:unnamed protein product [Timema podura]
MSEHNVAVVMTSTSYLPKPKPQARDNNLCRQEFGWANTTNAVAIDNKIEQAMHHFWALHSPEHRVWDVVVVVVVGGGGK